MLPLKFQAWFDDGVTQKMLFVGDNFGTKHPLDCCAYLIQGQPVTLRQYTGCKDTNQKEIYVGDIVTVPGIGKAVVDISPELGMVYLQNGTEYASLDCTVEGDYPTVIGNIYENPELLK